MKLIKAKVISRVGNLLKLTQISEAKTEPPDEHTDREPVKQPGKDEQDPNLVS